MCKHILVNMFICLEQGTWQWHQLDHMQIICTRYKWFTYGLADATATPSSLASLKSRMVYFSGAGLSRLSWKRGRYMGVCLVFRCNCFYVVPFLRYYQKLKWVTWPWTCPFWGYQYSIMLKLVLTMIGIHTKFEVPSFIPSKDRLGAQNFKGHVTLAISPLGIVCHTCTRTCHGQPVYQIWNL